MGERLVSIDKIARQAGVASSALRYYERFGLIDEGVKIGGRRHYPSAVLQRLSVIRCCQAMGFSLTQIAELLDDSAAQGGTWQEMARARRTEVQRQIDELHGLLELLDAAMNCPCAELCDCPHMGPEGRLARQPADGPRRPLDRWRGRTPSDVEAYG